MDKKFLHKVIDQLVRETIIYHDHDNERVNFPFHPRPFPFSLSLSILSDPSFFYVTKHCKSIYGLNDDEISYVWNEYREIIIDKIENNG
jgi:hypothetical protein